MGAHILCIKDMAGLCRPYAAKKLVKTLKGEIGIPIHWGFRGIAEDADKTAKTLANQLTPTVIDPNAFTPEFKGFLVKIEKA